jgi:hypothetical protein
MAIQLLHNDASVWSDVYRCSLNHHHVVSGLLRLQGLSIDPLRQKQRRVQKLASAGITRQGMRVILVVVVIVQCYRFSIDTYNLIAWSRIRIELLLKKVGTNGKTFLRQF